MLLLASSEAAALRASLLRWFGHCARPLPWRQSKSAYRVWLSEIMLQQTQVATVIPYYRRFIKEFPTVIDLAAAPLERVLELWSGLGYYRRARDLHRAARMVSDRHEGRFPRDVGQARALPGVGDYTARAVLSIAYDQPYPVIDGNVARVMARLLAVRGNPSRPAFRQMLSRNLEVFLSRRKPGNFNQAMMEVGQMVCLPRQPRCSACPLRRGCRAFRLRKPESFPIPRARRAVEEWHLATALLRRNHRILLTRGLTQGLLNDLWNFPSALGRSSSQALTQLEDKLRSDLKVSTALEKPSQQLQHRITYRSIQVRVYTGKVLKAFRGNEYRWFPVNAIERAAVSQLARKITRQFVHTREKQRSGSRGGAGQSASIA